MKKFFTLISRLSIAALLSLFLLFSTSYADYNSAEVVQHLGNKIPLNLKFLNSKGDTVLLKDLVNKPTVLDFCYYQCLGICTPLMSEIADVVGRVKQEPGKDYNIISISIDQNETPKMAAEKKFAMLGLSDKKIPEEAWTFLTGDSTNIYQLTDAAGFHFKRTYGGFLHKGVLIFLDKDGKIVQYMDPSYQKTGNFRILPSTFEMAISNASEGNVTSTIANVLKTCFSFVPKGKDMFVLMLVLFTGLLTVGVVIVIIKKVNPKKS